MPRSSSERRVRSESQRWRAGRLTPLELERLERLAADETVRALVAGDVETALRCARASVSARRALEADEPLPAV